MRKPNIFILHSLNGDTLQTWGQDVKAKMNKSKINVFLPEFPIRAESSFEKFDAILFKYLNAGTLAEDSIVIAHSIGNPYFIRFAKRYNFIPKAYISVAGFSELYPLSRTDYIVDRLINAIPSQEDMRFIKEKLKNKFSFYSDETIPLLTLKNFADQIEAQHIYLKDFSHFDGYSDIKEIPQLIELLEKLL